MPPAVWSPPPLGADAPTHCRVAGASPSRKANALRTAYGAPAARRTSWGRPSHGAGSPSAGRDAATVARPPRRARRRAGRPCSPARPGRSRAGGRRASARWVGAPLRVRARGGVRRGPREPARHRADEPGEPLRIGQGEFVGPRRVGMGRDDDRPVGRRGVRFVERRGGRVGSGRGLARDGGTVADPLDHPGAIQGQGGRPDLRPRPDRRDMVGLGAREAHQAAADRQHEAGGRRGGRGRRRAWGRARGRGSRCRTRRGDRDFIRRGGRGDRAGARGRAGRVVVERRRGRRDQRKVQRGAAPSPAERVVTRLRRRQRPLDLGGRRPRREELEVIDPGLKGQRDRGLRAEGPGSQRLDPGRAEELEFQRAPGAFFLQSVSSLGGDREPERGRRAGGDRGGVAGAESGLAGEQRPRGCSGSYSAPRERPSSWQALPTARSGRRGSSPPGRRPRPVRGGGACTSPRAGGVVEHERILTRRLLHGGRRHGPGLSRLIDHLQPAERAVRGGLEVGRVHRPRESQGEARRRCGERVGPVEAQALELRRRVGRVGDQVELERASGLSLRHRSGRARDRVVAAGLPGNVVRPRDADIVRPRLEPGEQEGVVREIAPPDIAGGDHLARGVEQRQVRLQGPAVAGRRDLGA